MKGLVIILVAAVLYGIGCSANAITQVEKSNSGTSGDWYYDMVIDEMTDRKTYVAYVEESQSENESFGLRCTADKRVHVLFMGELPLADNHSALVRFDKEKSEEVTAAMAMDNKGLFLAGENKNDALRFFVRKLVKHNTLRIRVVVKDQGFETYKFSLRGSRNAIRTTIEGCQEK